MNFISDDLLFYLGQDPKLLPMTAASATTRTATGRLTINWVYLSIAKELNRFEYFRFVTTNRVLDIRIHNVSKREK